VGVLADVMALLSTRWLGAWTALCWFIDISEAAWRQRRSLLKLL